MAGLEANLDKVRSPEAAELQRLLGLIAAKAGKPKSCIETVQCMAIDARLTLMVDETPQNPPSAMQAGQQVADELASLADDVETLAAEIRTVSLKMKRYVVQ